MQFDQRKRLKLSEHGEYSNPYPFWINFYIVPPIFKISLQEIEDCVTERLKILKVIDNLMKNSNKSKGIYDVMISQINSVKCNNNDKNFYIAGRSDSSAKAFEARKRDHISHFLLRIYYCQNEELRRWFISRETELFKARFIDSSVSNITSLEECLTYYGYNYEIVSTANNSDLHNKINWYEYNKHNLSSIAFKLDFEKAIDLIRMRRVYLDQGCAYIGSNEIISVICNQFKSNLSRELNKMHTYFYSFDEKRLLLRLESLHQNLIANANKTNVTNVDDSKEQIQLNKIDQLSKDLFPPCMRSIHETLRREHHLKHYGRLYYGLFLKSIGLTLDDAIEFFRSELSIKNPEKFQREYSYTIRYIYGKAGRRVQLSAYSCQKIINENAPGPNDTHGCPFRHYDIKNLKTLLVRYGINKENDLDEIIEKITMDKNFNGACNKFFSIKYQQELPENFSIYHPNQFYDTARYVLNNSYRSDSDKPLEDSKPTQDNMPIDNNAQLDSIVIDDSMSDYISSYIQSSIDPNSFQNETLNE